MTKEFNRHDNVDYDLVEINKDSLLLKLKECAEYSSLPAEVRGYGGLALTLSTVAFFTETSRGLWVISGETIQASFLVGAIVATAITLRKAIKWYTIRDGYTPEAIVRSLSGSRIAKPMVYLPAPAQTQQKSAIKKTTRRQQNTAPRSGLL